LRSKAAVSDMSIATARSGPKDWPAAKELGGREGVPVTNADGNHVGWWVSDFWGDLRRRGGRVRKRSGSQTEPGRPAGQLRSASVEFGSG
jgi:hypothetical protein